ncbi:hypothetical protein PVAG01_08837 [Phlyctema vagabunda]|uniref:BTB domain-containing protein n=1 Tax=Phlyctema vagabunda TaxID=108571 RepID=A0ABR4PAM9_9HELO
MPRASKRKKVGCHCGEHDTQKECDEDAAAEETKQGEVEKPTVTEKDDTPQAELNRQKTLIREMAGCAVVTSSRALQINCSEDGAQSFVVHEDLLNLHTNVRLFRGYSLGLPGVSPTHLAHFVSWMYTGDIHKEIDSTVEELWTAAKTLGSRRFKNHCMDHIRIIAKEQYEDPDRKPYPSCEEVTAAYSSSAVEESKLRLFMADCLSCCSPYSASDPEGNAAWDLVFGKCNNLSLDVLKAGLMNWGKAKPWDNQFRDRYVEDVMPLDEEWRTVLSYHNLRSMVDSAARDGNVKAIVKKAAFNENKDEE